MCHVTITVKNFETIYIFVCKSLWYKKGLFILKRNLLIESTKPLLEYTLPVCVIQGALLLTDYWLKNGRPRYHLLNNDILIYFSTADTVTFQAQWKLCVPPALIFKNT